MCFVVDEDTSVAVCDVLRKTGLPVHLSTSLLSKGASDKDIVNIAGDMRGCIVTHNRSDFTRLITRRQKSQGVSALYLDCKSQARIEKRLDAVLDVVRHEVETADSASDGRVFIALKDATVVLHR